ncbi:MAG TPA: aldo/keto reductase [Bacteroidetes bacterium]|nr:aldo/keto reductase [Bacteroidota bacterium]
MEYRILGRTALRVSEVGFGAWAIGGGYHIAGFGIGYAGVDDENSRAALRRALELGVNFIDTADAYGAGHSEELIGEVMSEAGWDGVYVSTKVGNQRRDPEPSVKNFSPEYVRQACEASLRRLRKDVIDVYLLHGPTPEALKDDALFDLLERLKEEGKIRYYGASINKMEDGIALIQQNRADVLQVLYNILDRQAEAELFPLAQKENIGIINRVPLSSGLLTGKFSKETTFPPEDHRSNWLKGEKLARGVELVEKLKPIAQELGMTLAELSLRFCLAHPAVHTIIPGAKNSAQVETNCAAGDGKALPPEVVERIKTLVPGDFGNPT